MRKGILGKKLGMTQIFTDDGEMVPVTVIEAGPCTVVRKRTLEKDGYLAIQLGFIEKKTSKVNKPMQGYFKNIGKAFYILRELRTNNIDDFEIGQEIRVDMFSPGDYVDVTGISKGKGFQGVVKRHGFEGGAASHGSMFHRRPGSIGSSTFPARVWKGKRLPGRMGNRRVTVQNLKVLRVDTRNNLLFIKGAVPGSVNSIVFVKSAIKKPMIRLA